MHKRNTDRNVSRTLKQAQLNLFVCTIASQYPTGNALRTGLVLTQWNNKRPSAIS